MGYKVTKHIKQLFDQDLELPSTSRFVLLLLADYADNETAEAYPSYRTLQRQTNMARSTVVRAVADLVDRGYLTKIESDRPKGSQAVNTYRITMPIDHPSQGGSVALPGSAVKPGSTTLPGSAALPANAQGGSTTLPAGSAALPLERSVERSKKPEQSTPPVPPSTEHHTHTNSPEMTSLGEDSEVQHALQAAERRRATRNAGSLLSQQHPRVWAALTDLQSIYDWKPTAFASIAEQLLNLARTNTDHRTELAIRTVIEAGATITHPIPYIRKLLTTNDTQSGTTTPRRSLRDGLTPLDSITLD